MILVQLKLSQFSIDPRCQARASFSEEWAEEMAEYLQAGGQLPPVVAYRGAHDYWLADGFHRHRACEIARRKTIEADVRPGTLRDAILHAVGANRDHGLKRSNPDKRKAALILLTDDEWGDWPNRRVADAAGVSEALIRTLREQLAELADDKESPPGSVGFAFETQSLPEPSGIVETLANYRRPRQKAFGEMTDTEIAGAVAGETERWRPVYLRELRGHMDEARRLLTLLNADDALRHLDALAAALAEVSE